MTLYNKHLSLIEAVNESKTVEEHAHNKTYLMAWRMGVKDAEGFISQAEGDMYYLKQGIHRPMRNGVWLDWEPEH